MRRLLLILSALAVAACGSGPQSSESSALYGTVPSRAVAVMHFDRCSDALALVLDSTSLFRSLDYGHLSDNEAILSFDYSAGLVPLLSIDAGRASADTSSQVSKLLERAAAEGFRTHYTAASLPRRSAVLISRSQAAIDEAVQHISSGTSILDAPGFREALALGSWPAGEIILKNGAAKRWIPARMLKDRVPRKSLVGFVEGVAQWTVLGFRDYSREGVEVRFQDDGNAGKLSHLFAGLDASECRLGAALPEGTDFVVDLPLADWHRYYDALDECLDVRAVLSRHKGKLAGLARRDGRRPVDLMEEMNPREIALLHWDGHEVLLLRPAKKPAKSGIAPNPYSGHIAAVFGSAFAIADDSFTAPAGEWYVFGNEEDVSEYLDAEKAKFLQEIPKTAKYYLYNDVLSLQADGKNIILNVH